MAAHGGSASSPTEGRRQQNRARTRAALIEAAAALFTEVGFVAARTSDIAIRAGVSEATLFRYFDTKADLALSESIDVIGSLRQAIVDQPRERNPYEAIAGVVDDRTIEGLALDRIAREISRVAVDLSLGQRLFRLLNETRFMLALDFSRRVGEDPFAARPRLAAAAVIDIAIFTVEQVIAFGEETDPVVAFREALELTRPMLDIR